MLHNESSPPEIDPLINVTINSSHEGNPSIGANFSITCCVPNVDQLEPNITYAWRKTDNTTIISSSDTYTFTSLGTADAGVYTCEANVSSVYLVNGSAKGMTEYDLTIKSKQNDQ